MFIDFSSRPPVPELTLRAPHLANYRRVYQASEAQVHATQGEDALAGYLATYDRLGARAVVIKARDLESTFGVKIANEDVAQFCRRHGDRYIGFAGVDPHKGEQAVRDLEYAVRELGLRGLNVQCFEHKLPIDDPLLRPLYAKCVELDIPVNIHCGTNFSVHSLMEYGHPRGLDRVMCAFPSLRVCASPPGWPWVQDLIGVAWRHPNVWIGVLAVRPHLLTKPHSGYEPLLQYGKSVLKHRMVWGSAYPMMPVERTLDELRALPMPDEVRQAWLLDNAEALLRL
jgi:Predicted metal-dependent hydrolase of the TIM-barrel fold